MARTLEELVPHYGELDTQAKAIKKEMDSDKVTIKNLLAESNQKNFTAGGYTVNYVVRTKVTVDEDKMLNVLKADWKKRYGDIPCPYIKTKEYVDMDQLESVLYANELPTDVMAELDKCQTKTENVALMCSKAKAE